jgi:hypothetical protein
VRLLFGSHYYPKGSLLEVDDPLDSARVALNRRKDADTALRSVEFKVLQNIAGEIHMDIPKQHSHLDSVGPTHQRSTLIELLVLISIIGPLVGR